MRSFTKSIVLVTALLCSACGDSSAPAGGSGSSVTVGANGGTVSITTGPLAGTRIVIPPGALNSTSTYLLHSVGNLEIPGYLPVGPSLRVLAGTMDFSKAVGVTLPFDPALIPAGAALNDVVVVYRDESGDPATVSPDEVAGGTVSFDTDTLFEFQPAVPIVAIVRFEATPASVLADDTSILSWESVRADSCEIDQTVGPVATTGMTAPLVIDSTTAFEITCQGIGGPVSAVTTVTVSPPVAITSFEPDPDTIIAGESAGLSWSVENATGCTIDGGVGSVGSADGTVNVSPASTRIYELSCEGAGGPVSENTTVTVIVPVTIDSFAASSIFVTPGDQITLSWTTSEATSCEINPGGIDATPVAAGDTQVTINNSTNYSISCQGPAGPAAATRPIWVPGEVAGGMAPIPAGCSDLGPSGASTEVCFGRFAMDIYEVTNDEYLDCMAAGACATPERTDTYSRPELIDHPIVDVSWFDAVDYCTWVGRRLPTADEWEYAARGGLEGFDFPWGNGYGSDDLNCCNFVGGTLPVGQYDPNGYGLYDMSGNVWEWVDTVASGSRMLVLGGSFFDSGDWARVWFREVGHSAGDPYYDLGFRCIETAAP